MTDPEFSHPIKARHLPEEPVQLAPNEAERAALAQRFDLGAVTSLSASITLDRNSDAVIGRGKLRAQIVQECAVTGDDVPVHIAEDLILRFVPAKQVDPAEELEITFDAEEADEVEYEGDSFDLGEAVAQTLGLAIDPFVEGPNANHIRKEKGLLDEDTPSGPLAEALAGLKSKQS